MDSFIRADRIKSSSPKNKASVVGTSTLGAFPVELRCYKHSPRVARKENATGVDNLIYDSQMWQKTFNTMGRLSLLGLNEFVPFTTLNKAPYHCQSLSRSYKVSHGTMSHVEGRSVKGIEKTMEAKASFCNCIDPVVLPQMKDPVTVDAIVRKGSRKPKMYIPKSCVKVWWDSRKYDPETICEWLQRFGAYQYTIYKGVTTFMVFFNTIVSAYRAVNCPLANSGIIISWYDVKLYNNGYYRLFENFTLDKDEKWMKCCNLKKKLDGLFDSTKDETQGKRLKSVNF